MLAHLKSLKGSKIEKKECKQTENEMDHNILAIHLDEVPNLRYRSFLLEFVRTFIMIAAIFSIDW